MYSGELLIRVFFYTRYFYKTNFWGRQIFIIIVIIFTRYLFLQDELILQVELILVLLVRFVLENQQ